MMQGEQAYSEKLNIYVKHTVDSGVKPIEVLLQSIYDCYNATTLGYRTIVRVNSMLTGVLQPDDYLNGSADESVLTAFTYRSIEKALFVQCALQENQIPFKRLFVRCPASFLYAEDLYTNLRLLLAKGGVKEKENRLCLEFDASVMDAESRQLSAVFSDIRAAGCKIAVNGYGGEAFSMEKLLTICPDYLFTADEIAPLAVDREKRSALAPMINFAKSLGSEVIACALSSDEELREFRSRDCFGFIPDRSYRGALAVEGGERTLREAIERGGEDD